MNVTYAVLTEALAHHQAGRLSEAEAGYRRVLGAEPANIDALHLLGALAHRAGRHEAALELIGQAIGVNPAIADFHASLGTALKALGRLPEAAASYERALALDAEHLDALNNLGAVRTAQGRLAEAETLFRRALARKPDFAEALNNLGNALMGRGRLEEAEASFRGVLALAPHLPQVHARLANALQGLGRAAEAERHYRQALELQPDLVEAHCNLASALAAQGRLAEAVASARRALALDPRVHEAYLNLANALLGLGRLDEAAGCCQRVLELTPDAVGAHVSLGNVLAAQGRVEEAIACYRRALERDPACAEAQSNLIFALEFHPATTSADAFAERRRWNALHARPLMASGSHPNEPAPDRRLRVGYVSADFRENSAAMVFGPVVLSHDRERVDVVCYSGVLAPDHVTARFEAAATLWRSTVGVTDETLARTIREDGIDILVDLSGYSSGHRLKVFAMKPAPIQVTAWGHAMGTGLDAMDYFFADHVSVPPAARRYFSEAVIDLPAFVPYSPLEPSPEVGPLPALGSEAVTFGCFNRLSKVTPGAMRLWARVVAALPTSRVLLKVHGVDDPLVQDRLRATFTAEGGDARRMVFLGGSSRWDHLAAYGLVDLVLDPFPHGGGVTALDGLWMGVPMVTLVGERIPSRIGASILTTLGLEEFVAQAPEDYVALAIRHARDLPGLARRRAELRARLAGSIICDHGAYCRAVEEAYRAMWVRWCGTRR